jgi:hypothetical protein
MVRDWPTRMSSELIRFQRRSSSTLTPNRLAMDERVSPRRMRYRVEVEIGSAAALEGEETETTFVPSRTTRLCPG